MRKIVTMLATTMMFSMTALATEVASTESTANAPTTEQAPVLEMQVTPGEAGLLDSSYSYNFGRVPVGRTAWANFTLRNTGWRNMWIRNSYMMGNEFAASNNCPRVLAPRMSCRYQIRYSPWHEGQSHGVLRINTDGGRIMLHLYGWGVRRW